MAMVLELPIGEQKSERCRLSLVAFAVVAIVSWPGNRAAADVIQPPKTLADQLIGQGLDKAAHGDCADALTLLRNGIRADADKSSLNAPTAFFVIANCEVRLGELPAAVEDYGSAIDRKPDYALAFANRARIRDRLDDHAGALSDIDKALEIEKNSKQDPTFYSTRGMILFALEHGQAALADLDTAVRLDPTDAEALLDRAIVEENLGLLQASLADAGGALAIDPRDVEALHVRASAEAKSGNSSAARADLSAAIALDAEDADAYAERGVLYLDSKDYSDAKADLSRAIGIGPAQAVWYYDKAAAEFSTSDLKDALADATSAIAAGDGGDESFALRGAIRERMGDARGAIADLTGALRLAPDDGDRYYDRAFAYYLSKDDRSALADLRRAIALRTQKPAYRLKAIVEVRTGDMRSALADFSRAIREDPRDDEAYMRRGLVKVALHDGIGAIADEKAAVALARASKDDVVLHEAQAQLKRLRPN